LSGGRPGFRPVIGMLQQELLEIFAEQWLGAVDAARTHQCDLITFCGGSLAAPGFRGQANVIYDLVSPQALDALIIWTTVLGINVSHEQLAEYCRRFDPLPVVSVEQPLGAAPVVSMANRRGMYEAVSHLIEAHGHRRIAFLRGPAAHVGIEERYQGYLDAMADHGLPADPELVSAHAGTASAGAFTLFGLGSHHTRGIISGSASSAVRLDEAWIRRLLTGPLPDAVAAANDGFAVAAMSVLASAGVRTPEDIAFVGFDDSVNASTDDLGFHSGPRHRPDPGGVWSLTTVRAPFHQLGWRAVEVARALVLGQSVPEVTVLPTELVVRTSCGCPAAVSQPPSAVPSAVVVEQRNQIMRDVGQELITAVDVAGLVRTLPDELVKIGIPGAHLAVYESVANSLGGTPRPQQDRPTQPTSTARSRLLLSYADSVATEEATDLFPSVQLVPGNRLGRSSPTSLVATPLYFKDQQLGYALFELGPEIGWIYAALRDQLSTALHHVLMVERERAALAALEEAHRREERQRLASELHDSVSQALFSMTLHTRALELAARREGIDPGSPLPRGLAALRELTQGALSEMRVLIFQLRPEALHQDGLVAAVRKHAAAIAARDGFEISVQAAKDHLPLDEQAETELFRLVQEAVHNSVKHARPSRIDIRFREPDEPARALVVEVADDGVGFDPDLIEPGHLGLKTMRERTERLGGRFVIDSSATGPTTVRAVLPGILRSRTEPGSTPAGA